MRTLTANIGSCVFKITILCAIWIPYLRIHAQSDTYREVFAFVPEKSGGLFYSFAYSLDNQWIAVSTYDPHGIEIRRAATGQRVKTLSDKSEQLRTPNSNPIWSPDSRYVAEVSIAYGTIPKRDTGITFVWDVKTQTHLTLPNQHDPASEYADVSGNIGIRYVAWNPDGKEFLIMDNDRKIRLLDFPSMQVHWMISPYVNQPNEFKYAESEYPCQPQWNPDGNRFVCIGDGIQAVFDGITGNYLFDLQNEVGLDAHSAWTHDGKYILNVDVGEGANDLLIKAWNAQSGARIELPVLKGLPYAVSPESTKIAYMDELSYEINVASLKTGDTLARLAIDSDPRPEPAWSPDGNYLLVLDRVQTAHVFAPLKKD